MNMIKKLVPQTIKNVNQIPAQIYDAWNNCKPEFVVIGITHQPRNNPMKPWDVLSYHVGSYEELLHSIAQHDMKHFNVFNVSDKYSVEGKLKEETEVFIKNLQEKTERETYERLKKKFDPETVLA